MLRVELAFRNSSALRSWTVLAIVSACSVYDASLLTGGSGANGGTSATGGSSGNDGGEPSGGVAGNGAMTGGKSGTSGTSGSGGVGGAPGGAMATGGTDGGEAGEETGGSSGAAGSGLGGAGSGGLGGAGSGGLGGAGSGGKGAVGGIGGAGGNCGVCGCNVPDTDGDSDGVPDCNDLCMGFDDAHCTALRSGLRNRYSFNGTGTAIVDSKGTANGTAVNATLAGTGTLTLSGGDTASPPYVNLPNGLISSLTNATLELWVTWNQSGTTGQNWQRIFDFGTSGTEDMQTAVQPANMTYLFLTPLAGTTPRGLRATYSTMGTSAETSAGTATALATGVAKHIVLVIDDANNLMSLYLDGALQQATPFTAALAGISDVNNWLGRSQWSGDYEFRGVFDEFRIYTVALTAAQIATSRATGPDAGFLP